MYEVNKAEPLLSKNNNKQEKKFNKSPKTQSIWRSFELLKTGL